MKHATRILMLGCAILAFAGAASAAAYQVGVKGGIAIQTLGGDDVEADDLESRTGFAGGAYFQADMSRNFGVRLEALYFMKGATADSSSFEAAFKLDYIEFPILLLAHVPMSETARLSIFGGPTLGFNTAAEIEGSAYGLTASLDISDYIESFEFGLTFGAGMSFDVGSVVLGIDGRYGIGMTTVANGDFVNDAGEQADVTNQGFAFMVSVGVPVGAK